MTDEILTIIWLAGFCGFFIGVLVGGFIMYVKNY